MPWHSVLQLTPNERKCSATGHFGLGPEPDSCNAAKRAVTIRHYAEGVCGIYDIADNAGWVGEQIRREFLMRNT
jgi:hypothetical protein